MRKEKMIHLLVFLSVISSAAAGNYKGEEVVKVGKKTYRCSLNINYSLSPPKCAKATAKCKPHPKKPIRVSLDAVDANLSFSVQKNKVKGCKVEVKEATMSTTSPGIGGESSPSPGWGSNPSSPLGGGGGMSTSPVGGSSPLPGEGGGMTPFPGGGNGSSPFPPFISAGPSDSSHMNCNCRIPLMEQPAVALKNLHLGHSIARIAVDKAVKDRAEAKVVKDRAEAKVEKEMAGTQKTGALQRTFTLPSLPTLPADLSSLVPALLIAFVSVIVGILKGMLLSSVFSVTAVAAGRSADQARALEKIMDRKGLEDILDAILGGSGGDGAIGGFQETLVSMMLKNMIDQIISDPSSLQEMVTLAVNNGLAEQVVNNLVKTGDISTLIQNLVDSGAGPDIIGNLGNGLVQELLTNNELANLNPAELTQMLEESLSSMWEGMGVMLAGVDVQNMEMNMQCQCVKEDSLVNPVHRK